MPSTSQNASASDRERRTATESRPRSAPSPSGQPGVGRRALLIGGGAALLGGAGLLAAQSDHGSGRRGEPRQTGEVDHPGAEWIPASPANLRRADRPHDMTIDRVVVHMPEATYPITLQVFQDPEHGAAAHYVVRSHDGHVAQLVRELDVAYHAGNWDYNERSVGIEHEGWANRPEYLTDAMYRSSAQLTAGICERYNIPVDREHILGHREVPHVDRVCPGEHWDWDRYLKLVRAARRSATGRPATDRGTPRG